MPRRVTISKMKPEKVDQYLQMHANPWPEVCKIMAEHHHTHHSLYRYNDYLFQYFEYSGIDFEKDLAEMKEIPIMQQWWAQCRECVMPINEMESQSWVALEEIFHNTYADKESAK